MEKSILVKPWKLQSRKSFHLLNLPTAAGVLTESQPSPCCDCH